MHHNHYSYYFDNQCFKLVKYLSFFVALSIKIQVPLLWSLAGLCGANNWRYNVHVTYKREFVKWNSLLYSKLENFVSLFFLTLTPLEWLLLSSFLIFWLCIFFPFFFIGGSAFYLLPFLSLSFTLSLLSIPSFYSLPPFS